MSVFTAEDLANPLETLVGEGKKYSSIEELAKGQINAEVFIDNLKRENGELRTDLQQRLSIEDMLSRQQRTEPPKQAPVQASDGTPPPQAPAPKIEDLVSVIREINQEERQSDLKAANINAVSERLTELFGSPADANKAVRARAQELGVSVDFFQSVAAQSPKAFFAQFGDLQPHSTPSPNVSSVNTLAFSAKKSEDQPDKYAFYEKLRREDPRRYFSPTVQNQIMKHATEQGDSFYT